MEKLVWTENWLIDLAMMEHLVWLYKDVYKQERKKMTQANNQTKHFWVLDFSAR